MNLDKYISNLKETYNGKNLPDNIRDEAINIYRNSLPSYYFVEGDEKPIVTFNFTLIAERYTKIIFQDYGPYLMVFDDDIVWDNLVPKLIQNSQNQIFYEIENYPNFECVYIRYNKETDYGGFLLIPIEKVIPFQND